MNLIAAAILDRLKSLNEGEEDIIILEGQAFVISRATPSDIQRISKGYNCMD